MCVFLLLQYIHTSYIYYFIHTNISIPHLPLSIFLPLPLYITIQPWYLHPLLTCLLGGILPFGACFVELFFLMSSIWMDQYYYVFGFLLLVYIILAVTCAEIAIVLNYFQLCSEGTYVCTLSRTIYVIMYLL